jgi:hypothetical protein
MFLHDVYIQCTSYLLGSRVEVASICFDGYAFCSTDQEAMGSVSRKIVYPKLCKRRGPRHMYIRILHGIHGIQRDCENLQWF